MRILMGLCLLLAARLVAAQCVQVIDQGFERETVEQGDVAPTVTWRATLANECDQAFDADLTIDFLDGDGNSVYQIRDMVTVSVRAEVQAGKSVYLPSTHSQDLADMRIQVEERERPF
jgi:hypothetical protein